MKAVTELLGALREIEIQIRQLSEDPGTFELDLDAITDLNLARQSIDKLINRVERLVN